MKKFGAIVLAGLMAVSLVGCGGNSSSKNEEKTYIIATDKTYPPFEMEDDSGNAKAIHDYFIKRVADVTGIYESFVNQPDKYIHFVRLDKFLSEKGWDPTQFIDAQFESLAWCNGLPEPSQMYNDKAIERYNKYLFKHKNHSQSEEPKVEGSLWSKINKL